MAMDQMETFNWLVAEKSRLELELVEMREQRDKWAETAFDLAFKSAIGNPAIQREINKCREAEQVGPEALGFVLR